MNTAWREDNYDRLPALAADLVRTQGRVIMRAATTSALAAKSATSTLPIVFFRGGADPVAGRDGSQPRTTRRQPNGGKLRPNE